MQLFYHKMGFNAITKVFFVQNNQKQFSEKIPENEMEKKQKKIKKLIHIKKCLII